MSRSDFCGLINPPKKSEHEIAPNDRKEEINTQQSARRRRRKFFVRLSKCHIWTTCTKTLYVTLGTVVQMPHLDHLYQNYMYIYV